LSRRRSNPVLLAARAQSKSQNVSKSHSKSASVPDLQPGWLFASKPLEVPLVPAADPQSPAFRRIFTVQSLVGEARQLIEQHFADVWVEGETSNLRPAASGHLYFTLKDADAQLNVVLFRRQASLLRFQPQDGMAVLTHGKISIYENRGQLQLVADLLEPLGAGALQIAFEQLKAGLAAEGLFAAERKLPLPPFPSTLGIITSPTGAVVQDMITILSRRNPRLNVQLYPAVVQGENTAAEVIAGITWFNNQLTEGKPTAEIIVLARGGGSIEDLWGFNDEALARAIVASDIPIVSAVGHETDFTIADFAADLRAPTPSAAAELVTAAQFRIGDHVAELAHRVFRACRYQLMRARERFAQLSADAVLEGFEHDLGRRLQRLDDQRFRLQSAMEHMMRDRFRDATLLRERMMRQDVTQRLAQIHARLARATARLAQAPQLQLHSRRARLLSAQARLESLSPLAVLGRGYALVFNAQGGLLTNAADAAPGDTITTRLAHGELSATVKAIRKAKKKA
jgi:exodeoxyribonuclease VII large subunit